MNQRERLLFGGVVGVLGLTAAVKGVHSWYVAPRQQLLQERAAQQARADVLDLELARANRTRDAWGRQTQRTLSAVGYEAHGKLRAELSALVARHGFSDVSVREAPARQAPKGHREGFVELPVTINGKTTLPQLVSLLRETYERPFFVRVNSVNINGESVSRPSSAKEKSPEDSLLNVTLNVSTLILPSVPNVPAPTLDLASAPDMGTRIARGEKPALRRESLEEYDEIARVNFFKLYTPPPPPPAPRPVEVAKKDPLADVPKPDKPKPAPPVDQRKFADKLKLVGVTTLHGAPVAFVEDESKSTEPPAQYHLNDVVDGGRLVLVHPRGMVVRVRELDGVYKNYYYEVGGTFKERAEVRAESHPEIDALLRLVLKS